MLQIFISMESAAQAILSFWLKVSRLLMFSMQHVSAWNQANYPKNIEIGFSFILCVLVIFRGVPD